MKFSPYSKCRVKLTYTGAAIFNSYLEEWANKFTNKLLDEYEYDYEKERAEEEIQERKLEYPQRFRVYNKGDYYEDDFDFIMDILMSNMAYNKLSFAHIFCYVGDGDENNCWFEIIQD